MRHAVVSLMLLILLLTIAACERSTRPLDRVNLDIEPVSGVYPIDQYVYPRDLEPDTYVYYTTDGSEPTEDSLFYPMPQKLLSLLHEGVMSNTFKFKAFRAGYEPSVTITRTYTLPFSQTTAQPLISPSGLDQIEPGTLITITCPTPDVQIRYTLDGSYPDLSSSLYTEPFPLTHPGHRAVYARAFREDMNPGYYAIEGYWVRHIQPEMIQVEGGSFYNEGYLVNVPGFMMDKTEVLQTEFNEVMGDWESHFMDGDRSDGIPIYYVSWFDAIAYCNKRSILDGLEPVYRYENYGNYPDFWPQGWNTDPANQHKVLFESNKNGYSLPTGVQWSFAALGGNQSQGFPYSGADSLTTVAWFNLNSSHTVHPVATKLSNELGFYDLSGNLWEWCWDSVNDGSSEKKLLKGGSYYSSASTCEVVHKWAYNPAESEAATIGFRCVRHVP
ncbi:MAG: SUMF1/EgtB/PvdO family nonheme iron enzyme [Candidatus Cloacimonetes bacterium]|nr:SUMF1/EgtB/PvdO family nonheme iron enzyme [Candidatus Cloacimonadota bacterium]